VTDASTSLAESYSGRLVLDVGAGTGAASRAIAAAGGRPIGVDRAVGMLMEGRPRRPPGVAGDALALPIGDGAVGGVVATFSFTHLRAPDVAFGEAARVTARGGPVVASGFAEDDDHPAKAAVEQAAREAGWEPPPWFEELRREVIPILATPERLRGAAAAGGVTGEVRTLEIDFGAMDVGELIAWRVGMAQLVPFLAGLGIDDRTGLERRASELLGDPPPLVRRVLVLAGVAG
jgi:SAM-dependent methyltransferase